MRKQPTGGKAKISDETVSFLRSIWADAQGDVTNFKIHLESWFDETMDRASVAGIRNTPNLSCSLSD